jgi:hypothetical protein
LGMKVEMNWTILSYSGLESTTIRSTVLGNDVTYYFLGNVQVRMDQAGGDWPYPFFWLSRPPEFRKVLHIGQQVFFALSFRDRSDDKPLPLCLIRSTTSFRNLSRSASSSILRETPTWSTVGIYTRCRPGSEIWEVIRAPLVPIGSLEIWTRSSCPS